MEKNTAIRLNVIAKPLEHKGCAVIPQRWVVERSVAWEGRNRLTSKEYHAIQNRAKPFFILVLL